MRQLQLTLLVAYREIIPALVFGVAHSRDADMVPFDHCPRHHSDFWPPWAIMRGRNRDPPRNHAEEQGYCSQARPPSSREKEREDSESSKSSCQHEAQPRRGQIRVIDGQSRPYDERRPANKPDSRDQ